MFFLFISNQKTALLIYVTRCLLRTLYNAKQWDVSAEISSNFIAMAPTCFFFLFRTKRPLLIYVTRCLLRTLYNAKQLHVSAEISSNFIAMAPTCFFFLFRTKRLAYLCDTLPVTYTVQC